MQIWFDLFELLFVSMAAIAILILRTIVLMTLFAMIIMMMRLFIEL
jgi:hypothetical protein